MSAITPPTPPTLKKHGLTLEQWQEMDIGKCHACGTVPPARKLNIDHQHVRGYYTMPPERRRRYHRGLVCYMCNKYRLARGATVANLRAAADYLERYEERRDAATGD